MLKTTSPSTSFRTGIVQTWAERFLSICDSFSHWAMALIARFAAATVFWRSGRTKVDGFTIKDSTFTLFEHEYQVPLVPPELAAYMTTIAEHVFPVLLVIGLASRLSALALLFMTLVIQVFVYPEAWPTHILWATALIYVIGRGPGPFALDHLIRQRYLKD